MSTKSLTLNPGFWMIPVLASIFGCCKDEEKQKAEPAQTTLESLRSAYASASAFNDSLKLYSEEDISPVQESKVKYYDAQYHHYDSLMTQHHADCHSETEMEDHHSSGGMMSGGSGGMMGNNNQENESGHCSNGPDCPCCQTDIDGLHQQHIPYHVQ
ncbi:MAG: hypothetical protein HYY40_01115 [Bacteroidetes bacterium]|nr:hypothetical protein [Bacteroidota bacterium]